jgi:NAD(P)-dependent dehydrogenase (short-subunit alcohol dehydrogenase family)
MDATVVMACKSSLKCDSSAKSILQAHPTATDRIVTMTLDLSDLNSVWKFSNDVSARFDRIDILINNAGLVSEEGLRTKQGLEGLFGVMHMGHFALTKWLLPLLRKPFSSVEQSVTKPARVINIASEAFMFGSFHPSMLSNSSGFGDLHGEITDNCGSIGYSQLTVSCCPVMYCPHTNGYARAKLANVMHAKELQKVLDEEAIANLETCASGNLR